MIQGFSDEARAALLACYSPQELSALERQLATPNAALHLRCNELRSSRAALLEELRYQPELEGFRVEPHPTLGDVAVIPRKPCAPALAPYLALDADPAMRGPQRFIERKRLGLPPHEVFLDRVCAEAVLKGADVFVRGIRSASAGVDVGDAVTVYADADEPASLLRGAVCETLGPGIVLIGVGECRMDRPSLFREWKGLGVRMRHTVAGDLPSMSGVLGDRLYVQSLPSLTAAHVLGAKPGERVLDMCGAPGSKSTHIATNFLRDREVDARSCLVACERNHGKLAKLRDLCEGTLGLRCVTPLRADSTCLGHADARVPGLPYPRWRRYFDRVLLDPPCSALGLRPKLRQTATAATLTQAHEFQRLFFWCAVRMLRVGGVLVYSTCTLTSEENEGMVAHALRRYPCLALQPAEPRVGARGRVGASGLSEAQCAMVQRFEPTDGTEGFFIARFLKTCEEADDDGGDGEGAAAAGDAQPPPDSVKFTIAVAKGPTLSARIELL